MRILIVTAGSRGDVAPFTGLGQRLQQAGHQVAIAAHERFADLVRGCGLEHRLLPGDPVEMARARMAASSPEAIRSVFAGFLGELGEGLIAATDAGADLIVTAFGPAPLSRTVAEGFGIPSIGAYLVPAVPSVDFPLPGGPGPADLGPAGNLAAGREQLVRAGGLYGEILPPLRTRLGLRAAVSAEPAAPPQGWPIFHGFSPAVLPRPDDWPAEVRVTGYWWPATPSDWHPPAELVDFLGAGSPPVFVGFGSMRPAGSAQLTELVTDAVGRAGLRAVVQEGWAGLAPVADDVLPIGDVPHDWLFPRMAAVLHHAGAGTTGAGLRAGVPVVTAPVMLDQPFWATRLHRLGVGPPPLQHGDLTADAIAHALRSCVDEPSFRDRAVEVAGRVRAEDGAGAVLAFIAGSAG